MKAPLPAIKGGRVLADSVTGSLREAILQGYFEPGEKLDQDLIAEELKVSRTPVREALKVLESEGFVEIRPHRGAFIPKVSIKMRIMLLILAMMGGMLFGFFYLDIQNYLVIVK